MNEKLRQTVMKNAMDTVDDLFFTLLNPRRRGPKFTWDRFVEEAVDSAVVECYHNISDHDYQKDEEEIFKLTKSIAKNRAENILKETDIRTWWAQWKPNQLQEGSVLTQQGLQLLQACEEAEAESERTRKKIEEEEATQWANAHLGTLLVNVRNGHKEVALAEGQTEKITKARFNAMLKLLGISVEKACILWPDQKPSTDCMRPSKYNFILSTSTLILLLKGFGPLLGGLSKSDG